MVAAYVLAGELARAEGDHRAAFARYESRLRAYVRSCSRGGGRVGKFLAPRTRAGARFRNAVLSRRLCMNAMISMGKKVSGVSDLPDYAAPAEGVAG